MTSSSHYGRSSVIGLPIKNWLVIGLILLGAALRINGLARNSRLHPDEALFASYARQMVLYKDWNLYEEPIDKPPTTFVLVGGSLAFLGEHEFAVRFPNFCASVLSLAITYQLARKLNSEKVAQLALFFLALSPLDIAYAPTGFQDPMMLFTLLASTLLLLHQRWLWGGVWLGLAFCMKPTAIYMYPLIIGLNILHHNFIHWRKWLYSFVGTVLPIAILILWDMNRAAQSLFELGNYNNNPNRFIRSDEVLPRAWRWLDELSLITATPLIGGCLLLLSALWLWQSFSQRQKKGILAWWIATYCFLYFGWHWLIAFPIYERYWLPLLPFITLVIAQSLAWFIKKWQLVGIVFLIITFVELWQPAHKAIHLTDPQHGQQIDQVSQLLLEKYQNQIVYDYSLGWQLRWYLGQNPHVMVVYFPTAELLAKHLIQNNEWPRYFIVPNRQNARLWLMILEAYDIQVTTIFDEGNVALFELRSNTASSWVSKATHSAKHLAVFRHSHSKQ